MKYRLLHAYAEHPVGTEVYDFHYCTYGVTGDDFRATGVEHTAVTFDPGHGEHFFTVPTHSLERIP